MSFWSNVTSGFESIGSHLKDFGDWTREKIGNAWDNLKSGVEGNIDRFKNPFEAANDLTDWATSFLDTASGKTAQEQYDTTRNDALQQYQEQFDYKKESDELTRQREDTAYQRALADMQAAGINPLAASGFSGGADSGVEGGSLGEYTATPTASGNGGASGLSAIASLISPILGAVTSRAISKESGETAKTIAEINNGAKEKIANMQQPAKNEMAKAATTNAATNAKVGESTTRKNNADAAMTEYNKKYWEERGGNAQDPDYVKDAKEALYQGKKIVEGIGEVMQKKDEETVNQNIHMQEVRKLLPNADLQQANDIKAVYDVYRNQYLNEGYVNEKYLLPLHKIGKMNEANNSRAMREGIKEAAQNGDFAAFLNAIYPEEAAKRARSMSSH